MNNLTKKFQLFGMDPFSKLTGEKIAAIANGIELISDNDILAQEDRLEEYGAGIAKRNFLSHVNVVFDRQQVEVVPFVGTAHVMNSMRTSLISVKRGVVKYSFPVTGGGSLLKYGIVNKNVCREVEILNNRLVFEYVTSHYNTEFPPNVTKEINRDALAFKDEVLDESKEMNKEVDAFNNQLPAVVLPLLHQRLVKARKTQKNIADLNPFK